MKRLFNSTSSLIKPKITFIGGGKMTTAMVSNIIESKLYKPEQIIVSDYNKKKCDFFQQKWNIKTISDNYEASYNSDIIVLAIKPQSIEKIFKNLQNISNKLILSVIAGIPLKTYQDNLKNINKIVRIMPNTPCMIKEGMSVWCSTNLDENDKEIVELLLKSFGKEVPHIVIQSKEECNTGESMILFFSTQKVIHGLGIPSIQSIAINIFHKIIDILKKQLNVVIGLTI